MQYAQIRPLVEATARQTGKFLLREWPRLKRSDVRSKSANQLVSYVDEQAEALIREALMQAWPGAAFLGEEKGAVAGQDAARWIVDPLDGTTNYVHGIPGFCVSIALEVDGRPQIGAVYDPVHDQLYSAQRGKGANCNGVPIAVSQTAPLSEALLATGFPFHDYHALAQYLELLGHFMRHTQGIRRIGAAALDLAFVASGRFEGFFEYGLKPWDVAAGILLVEEAGGKVCDFSGHHARGFLEGGEMVATNGAVHAEMQEVVRHYLGTC